MTGLTLAVVLQISTLAAGPGYTEARQAAVENGRPLVVLVGADWCPACVTMKNSVMPSVVRSGGLTGAEFVRVNYDQQPELARKLMSGGSIPQLVVFYQTADGWKRKGVVGAQSASEVTNMVRHAVAASAPVAPKEQIASQPEAKPQPAVKKTSATGAE